MQPDTFFKQLRTKQVVIRRLQNRDLLALVLYRSQPAVAEQGRWPLPFTAHDAELLSQAQKSAHPNMSGEEFRGVFTLVGGNALVGEWSLTTDHIDHRQVDLSLGLDKDFLTSAYVHPILYALLTYLFDQLGKNKVRFATAASQHELNTLLGAFGMTREAHLAENAFFRGAWHDEYLYGMLLNEWRSHYKSLHRSLAHATNPNTAV